MQQQLNVLESSLTVGEVVHHYLIRERLRQGQFICVYLAEDQRRNSAVYILVEFRVEKINEAEVVKQELADLRCSLAQRTQTDLALVTNSYYPLIVQPYSSSDISDNLYQVPLPLDEWEVVQWLNQSLSSIRNYDNLGTKLGRVIHDLALTALVLLTGEYLYNSESQLWNWQESKHITDQRAAVLQRMLKPKDGSFISIDPLLQSLNILPPSPILHSELIPIQAWYLIGGIVACTVSLFAGMFYLPRETNLPQQPQVPQISPSPALENLSCAEGEDIVSIACGTRILDIDSVDFDGGKLTIKFKGEVTENDHLLVHNLVLEEENSAELDEVEAEDIENTETNTIMIADRNIGSYTGGSGTDPLEISLNEDADLQTIQSVMNNIVYQNSSSSLEEGTRIVEFQLTDGDGGISNILSRTISIHKENQPPIISVPSSIILDEDGTVSISGISVEDPDSGDAPVTVTLNVDNGALSTVRVDVEGGVSLENIISKTDDQVTFRASTDKINQTLRAENSITYQAGSDFYGLVSLTITINDGGGSSPTQPDAIIYPPGALMPKSDTELVRIQVDPINDNPILGQAISSNPTPVLQVSPTQPDSLNILTSEDAIAVVESWLRAKEQALGPSLNPQILSEYTTGGYFQRSINAVNWLRQNNGYYTFGEFFVEPLSQVSIQGAQATIDLRVNEAVTLTVDGKIDRDQTGPISGSYRFTLEMDNGRWKIADNAEIGGRI